MFIQGVLAVTKRHLKVWRANIWSSLFIQILEPLLVLFAFGFGLGQAFETMGGLPYIQFVVPGMMMSAAMYTVCFDAGYGSFFRRVYQHTYSAMLSTPLSMTQIAFGEFTYSVIRALTPATIVCAVGASFGGVASLWGYVAAIPVIALTASCLCAMVLSYAVRIKYINRMDYMLPVFITPQFLFCGVFMENSLFPTWIQYLSEIFPLTHALNLIRPLIAGQIPSVETFIVSLSYLVIATFIFSRYAIKGMRKALME